MAEGARQEAQNLLEIVRKGIDPKALNDAGLNQAEIQKQKNTHLEFGAYVHFFFD